MGTSQGQAVGPESSSSTGAGEPVPVWAVILGGGASKRWGGRDKTAYLLGGQPVLALSVASARVGIRMSGREPAGIVVVAPTDHPARAQIEAGCGQTPLLWVQEDPPGGGPLAGLAAAAHHLPAPWSGPEAATVVLALAGDQPFAVTAVPRLLAALVPSADAALGVDPNGHRQSLLAAYRWSRIRSRLVRERCTGVPMRHLLTGLHETWVPVTRRESFDLDTPSRLPEAEQWIEEWVGRLSE